VALAEGAAPGPYTYTIKKDNFGDPIKSGTLDLATRPASIEGDGGAALHAVCPGVSGCAASRG